MAQREPEQRVENIEETLRLLNTLPARVGGVESRVGSLETQFLQFRAEVRAEFSATRAEIQEVRTEARALQADAIAQARIMHEDLVERIKTLRHG